MNTNLADALILAESIKNGTEDLENIEIVLCPPFVWLYPMAEKLEKILGKKIKLGAQNAFWENEGAYTGEISPKMLKNLCEYVIVGHSERRNHLKETDEMINEKVHAVLRSGLKPVVCVGEYKMMREEKKGRGRPDKIAMSSNILNQLKASLERVSKNMISNVVIAYEPIWAIGTGHAATGSYAAQIINSIREKIYKMYDWDTATDIRILYGGSVNAENISEFVRQPEIDGVLAGGASLKAKEFVKMCQEMA